MFNDLVELRGTVSLATAAKCPKCHGSAHVHMGDRKGCTFRNQTDKVAQERAAKIEEAYCDGAGDD
jgi:hypothetical protein